MPASLTCPPVRPFPNLWYSRLAALLGGLLFLCALQLAWAEEEAGRLVFAEGAVMVASAGTQSWRPATSGMSLRSGDRVRTGVDGKAGLRLADETLLRLNRNSVFELTAVDASSPGFLKAALSAIRSQYRLEQGELWLRNNRPNAAIDIETPVVTAGIRGTEIDLRVSADGRVYLSVLEGQVRASNAWGTVEAGSGEAVLTRPGEAPVRQLLVNRGGTVQWTLRVPEGLIAAVTAAGQAPAVTTALARLRAGAIEPAREVLTEHLAAKPEDATAWQLQALTALLLADAPAASTAAAKALALAPGQAEPWVISGYVAQSRLDLEAALSAYERALALEPDNLNGWMNRAQVLFGSDRLDEAAAAAATAAMLAPGHPEVLTVQGFLLLARNQSTEALARFEQASAVDPGYAEPRLGQALALMRLGQIEPAFDAAATAVLLEPARALFLGYWGRMLYQAGRLERALIVLQSAALTDPNDPSPWFYRALILRDLNHPAEAIEALNAAVARNDNRAVYRSRFLLDRDLATRNVTLSRLYTDLGLDAWAESKALETVKTDFTNFAGHMFYAEAVGAREDRFLSYASESLLSRILMPANLNSFNTFNEYTSFFEQPSQSWIATATVGSHDLRGGTLQFVGAQPQQNLVYTASGDISLTDGWRDTNGTEISGVNSIAIWEPTGRDSLSLSARIHTQSNRDEIGNRYSVDQPSDPREYRESDGPILELGYHRHFGPRSDFVVAGSWNQLELYSESYDRQYYDELHGSPLELEIFNNNTSEVPYRHVQGQWIRGLGRHQLILGGTWYHAPERVDSLTSYTLLYEGERYPVPDATEWFQGQSSRSYRSLYAHDLWSFTPRWTLETGVTLERMETGNIFSGTEWTLNEVNPRLGLIWRPAPAQTLRAAGYRYLISPAFSRIDPMDVVGIPLYRSGDEGTIGQGWDLSWEREWARSFLKAGIFQLDTEVVTYFPRENAPPEAFWTHGQIDGVELAFNHILTAQSGLSLRYRGLQVTDSWQPELDRDEHQLRLGLRYRGRNGLQLGLGQTWRRLDYHQGGAEDISITDVSLGYELRGKQGLLSLRVQNLFDEQFNWVVDRFVFDGRQPARTIIGQVQLYF